MKKSIAFNARQLRDIAVNVRSALRLPDAPKDDGKLVHERIVAVNAALFDETYHSEYLDTFSVGWRDPESDEALNFYSPGVQVPEYFEYTIFDNAEEWFSDEKDDDLRPMKGEFATVEYTENSVIGKTENRGLRIVLDKDKIKKMKNWREFYGSKLLRRIRRNRLRRSIAALSAGAVNTNRTWDTTAGKDPDQDVMTSLIAAADVSGIRPNRVGYGDTAWAKRALAHRAQASAGGFSSAGLTPDMVAGFLGVDRVHHTKARYQSSPTAKTQIVGNLVLSFFAEDNLGTEDPSNIKRFWSPCANGQEYMFYERDISTKLTELAVEYYDLLKITSLLGLRKETIS